MWYRAEHIVPVAATYSAGIVGRRTPHAGTLVAATGTIPRFVFGTWDRRSSCSVLFLYSMHGMFQGRCSYCIPDLWWGPTSSFLIFTVV